MRERGGGAGSVVLAAQRRRPLYLISHALVLCELLGFPVVPRFILDGPQKSVNDPQ